MSDVVAVAIIAALSANALAVIGGWVTLRSVHKAVNSERTAMLLEVQKLREELVAAGRLQAMTERAVTPLEEDMTL